MIYMGASFPAVELDNAIRFITLSRMSGFLWHSSKWAHQFACFLQYMSGFEVLACSLDTDLRELAATFREKMRQFLGCILIDRYVTPATLSPGPEALCWISGKIRKLLRSLAYFLSALAFLCCHYILTHLSPAWPLALTLYMCTSIHMNFWSIYSLEQYLFWPHSNLF